MNKSKIRKISSRIQFGRMLAFDIPELIFKTPIQIMEMVRNGGVIQKYFSEKFLIINTKSGNNKDVRNHENV